MLPTNDHFFKHKPVWNEFFIGTGKKEMILGPIVIVDDDQDDHDIYAEAIRSLGITNELRHFYNGVQALEYIANTEEKPFIIISDINMPEMDGLALKKYIQSDPFLFTKGIPFVFISTTANNIYVRHAYALGIQGYFEKPDNIAGITEMLRNIFSYWACSKHINKT